MDTKGLVSKKERTARTLKFCHLAAFCGLVNFVVDSSSHDLKHHVSTCISKKPSCAMVDIQHEIGADLHFVKAFHDKDECKYFGT